MCVVKDGPDVALFTHPAALTKLALWIGEAIVELDHEKKGKLSHGGRGTPLVVASLHEARGVYVVVGTGGGGNGLDLNDKESKKAKKLEKEKKAKAKADKKKLKEKAKEEKRKAKAAARQAEHDDDDEDLETESEASDTDSDDSEEEEEEEENDKPRGFGRNRFGNAFQEVAEETNARVRIDSFEHCVVEVRKEYLSTFLESLSMKAVVG